MVDTLFELGPLLEGSHYLKATMTALFISSPSSDLLKDIPCLWLQS